LVLTEFLFTIFEHCYTRRPGQEACCVAGKEDNVRAFLALPPVIAPYRYTILPVDGRITRDPGYPEVVRTLKNGFTELNIAGQVDDSSAGIGKRYSRNDEVGIPFAITLDQETFSNSAEKPVTLRERNSCGQIRVPLAQCVQLVASLFHGANFADVADKYETVANAAVETVGVAVLN